MRVVLDTNVLISALLWKGRLTPLYHLINERKILLCFSKLTLRELIKVSQYQHIRAKAEKEKIDFLQVIKSLALNSISIRPKKIPNVIKEHPEDNKFLACAATCQASFIVSGDGHLLNLKEFKGIPVVSPREFLKIIKK